MASNHYFLTLLMLISTSPLTVHCYDPLDPYGNITVTFDIFKYTLDGYVARVSIQNYYQYLHVEKPGWKVGWIWPKNEVIWSMKGAFAVQQGNCSMFKYEVPHSCKREALIVDQTPDSVGSDGCCRGGVLASWATNPSKSYSSFEVIVGNLEQNSTVYKPLNLTLMAPGPGYTCSELVDTTPTVLSLHQGRREEQVSRTWKSRCTYSSYIANKTPVCCVSLSTFYNPTITQCPSCSCGCRVADQRATSCIREGIIPSNLRDADLVQCSDHMCPIRVHWHIKQNYISHWRVKLTVSNYNYGRNYSDWNVAVQHPGLAKTSMVSTFNSSIIIPTVSLFWGKALHNTQLLQADGNEVGSVSTEILMEKDRNSFTLSNGWAFPRRIYFNGEYCQMPLPDTFPMLPNTTPNQMPSSYFLLLFALYITYLLT